MPSRMPLSQDPVPSLQYPTVTGTQWLGAYLEDGNPSIADVVKADSAIVGVGVP